MYNKKNTPLYNMYKVYRNNLSRIFKVAKQQYYYILISSNKNDTKKLHQMLSDLINLNVKNNHNYLRSPLPQVLKLMTLLKLQLNLFHFQ